jgi:transcriptional regulator with XRE-family HTH domain
MESEDELLALIGARISRGRAALGLTLDELASRSGVSRAMISRIERGEVHASAVVLDRLCGGLGISLSTLFAREAAAPLLRRADQLSWRDLESGYLRREVAPDGTGSTVRIVEIELPPGAAVTFDRQPGRVLDQHIWVLEGEIAVTSAGREETLGPGDCLFMAAAERNGFANRSGHPARYAVILRREGMP